MPILSAFTPCGMLACSGKPSHLEEFYKLLPALWGSEIDFSVGTLYDEPHLYAVSRMLALALYELEHAGNQQYPDRSYDQIPLFELDFQLVPGPYDTALTRRGALAAAWLLPRGETASNVVNSLRALIGSSKFLAYVPHPGGATSSGFAVQSWNGFKDIRIAPRLVQIVDAVTLGPSSQPQWVAYQNFDTSIPTPILLQQGDKITIDGGNTMQQEVVTVAATSSVTQNQTTPGFNYFQATFTLAHAPGAPVTTGSYPFTWSTMRSSYVVVNASVAVDNAQRVRINALVGKLSRAVEQWFIVQPTSTTQTGGTVGPLTVGSPMGAVSVGAIVYANSM